MDRLASTLIDQTNDSEDDSGRNACFLDKELYGFRVYERERYRRRRVCCITVASSLSHASGNELFDGINDVFTAKNEHRSSFTCVFTSEDRIKDESLSSSSSSDR